MSSAPPVERDAAAPARSWEAMGVSTAPLPGGAPGRRSWLWLVFALACVCALGALLVYLFLSPLLGPRDDMPLDAVARLRLLGARLRQHVPGEAAVDAVAMYLAVPRYQLLAQLRVDGSIQHQAWGIHAWPDRLGKLWYLVAVASGDWRGSTVSDWGHGVANDRGGSFLALAPAESNETRRAILVFGPRSNVDVHYASAVLIFCDHRWLPKDLFHTWYAEGCSVGLGTRNNASGAELWPGRRCGRFRERCDPVWSYSRAELNSRLPCWDEAVLSMSARLSPDGRSLVARSPVVSVDYLWRFADGLEPSALQDFVPECRRPKGLMAGLVQAHQDRLGSWSPDGAFYAAGNASHIALFETAEGKLALTIPLGQPPPPAAGGEGEDGEGTPLRAIGLAGVGAAG
mmetsp:Transcript_85843/g.247892  ORF Transcript_85843/g.247892 Transcript_85843/m.247892 type:complete len:401 (-) Transcript_85843:9-1211(-)